MKAAVFALMGLWMSISSALAQALPDEGESGLTLGTDPGFFRPLRRGRF